MATTEKPNRRPLIPRIYRILSLLHPQLFKGRAPPVGPNKESNPLGMDRSADNSVRNAEETHVLQTRVNTTPIRQTVRGTYRCIGIWRGRHTLTRGRNQ